MKDWKKCTAFLLALVICLGLAACGVGSSEGEREDYLFVYFKRGDHRMKILMYCLLALNVGVWLMYGIDKWKAKSGRWRIPEKVLLLAAFAGGSVGALAGMMMFRHKTKKAKFVISVPIFFVIHCVIAGYVLLNY